MNRCDEARNFARMLLERTHCLSGEDEASEIALGLLTATSDYLGMTAGFDCAADILRGMAARQIAHSACERAERGERLPENVVLLRRRG
jgi:hypothetical protein